ncbi:unnamed protein product [Medioppia subpectinata]|uniref:Uncharacterized protein n=1 Tax=Medioppia subpectinata TaxID=1979941 RepID=A0A7R9L6E2_9ACAR|nr:unnamed protein product [Medioppia subpectinata]CAG2115158.1 unnamed protein product [Medioppia subpectinata]
MCATISATMNVSQTYGRQIWTSLKKNYGVWPVVVFAFGLAPVFVIVQSIHSLRGPDSRFSKDFEPWHKFDNKKFKFISNEDYQNYVHPRPRFEE